MKIIIKIKLLGLLFLIPVFDSGAQELEQYLEIAAENNPGLQAAYANYEAASQKAPQVKSLPDPTLTMSAFGRMEKARITLMQMFPWFGTLSARKDAASLMAEASFHGYLDRRNELYYRVSEQYFKLFNLDQKLSFQEENLEILEEFRNLSLARVRAGDGTLADVLQVELLLNEAKTAIQVLELEKKPLLAGFNALLNRKKDAGLEVPEIIEFTDLPILEIEEHFSANPQVIELEKRTEAARFEEEAARKSGLPSIGLGVDVMVEQRMPMDGQENRKNVVMPMVSVSLPIFRKKYNAAQKEAQYIQKSYSLQSEEVQNDLEVQFEMAKYELEKMREMLGLYERQVESSHQVLNLLLSSYSNAEVGFEEVLRVQQELLKYQLEAAQSKADYLTQMARINYLTGKSYNND